MSDKREVNFADAGSTAQIGGGFGEERNAGPTRRLASFPRSNSYTAPPSHNARQARRPSLPAMNSTISSQIAMLNPQGARSPSAGLFGALKFKGLLNVRLRARREKLGSTLQDQSISDQRQHFAAGSRGFSSYGSIQSSEGGPRDNSFSVSNNNLVNDKKDRKTMHSDLNAARDFVLGNKVCIFLLCIPFGVLAAALDWGNQAIFILNFFAILPLAQLLGDFTEEVALYTNDTIGGLLNATLGNATELIISIFAIQKGLLRVVQVSLLGSVLSNELLVTGCCFLFGGLYHSEQHFNAHIAAIDSSLLLMAVLGLSIPAAFSSTVRSDCLVPCQVDSIVTISHVTALMLFFLYGMLLVFQLKTHTHLMDVAHGAVGDGDEDEDDDQGYVDDDGAQGAAVHNQDGNENGKSVLSELEGEQDPEEATMSLQGAIFMLGVTTVLVAICSELLVGSIEEVSVSWGLSEVFIGLILLPIIGNAAEHATAITVAIKGKMDLALGVALGSSVQIALCVVPALCVVGWIVDKPLTLDFHPFETVVLVVSVLVVTSTVRQGTSTWLEGIMLIISYCIIAVAYFYRKEPPASAILPEPSCICGEACCHP
ncbi:Vacuolar cation/proton exchanger 2 [Hondaea fermentalgiana]|uniref:Vacuolar cation/proton exchanger 2 n=1 Tax=Hondaea fermentalgiana TaxID=2315210 RepID=A0A2R5GAT6_9STRA|nr:Vacuolar cation/proton exchanger 2 [Hondaea fermentalgiana]|eukprot:GBG25201.1 Vacuolar cation/proton exchanger 2 [Hondaea fermentalgiana]